MRVAIKPTPSIASPQHTVNKSGQDIDIEINGQILRASVYDWGVNALGGVEIDAVVVVDGVETDETVQIKAGASADMSLRLKILAAV